MEENLKQLPTDVIKIAIFGPESTGKTTLAKQLADAFGTIWAPEFARDYLQEKFNDAGIICQPEHIMPIAVGQTKLENDALASAHRFLFSDTCLMVTKVYSEMYYGFCEPDVDKAARKHKYDLFFLTDVDVPWEKDDLRDRPENREAAFETFKKALIDHEKPFILLSGDMETRLEKATVILEHLEKSKAMGFSAHDFVQIYNHGISVDNIAFQLQTFENGIAKTILDRPATSDDGIVKLALEDFESYAAYFDNRKKNLTLEKFVPASGAASRMFKFLNEFLNEFDMENETINAYINRKKTDNLRIFLAGMEKFPFYEAVLNSLRASHPDLDSWEASQKYYAFIKMLLSPDHFDFCNKPKGVLPFHNYKSHIKTAVGEHLSESAYFTGKNDTANLHFTVSDHHQELFEEIIAVEKTKAETHSKNLINVTFSYQDQATDTIAADLDNNPFRDSKGRLVFRPAGHGALIQNLNVLDSDVVFIKNIDNVIQHHQSDIALYKKALAGIMIELQDEIFSLLRTIETAAIDEAMLEKAIAFIEKRLHAEIISDFSKYTIESKIEYLKEILNRPIRVCGMVKNEGEPGGGPFWVRDLKGTISLQIVESSQIDLKNERQAKILAASTHFNPVDLVCGTKDYKGNKFDLTQFVDPNSGFIVEKNKGGKPLKAYELPGLWNGAMANWITVFVEVPLITFNPVKTVNDLLKSAHQPQ